jgi:hypothetical protein
MSFSAKVFTFKFDNRLSFYILLRKVYFLSFANAHLHIFLYIICSTSSPSIYLTTSLPKAKHITSKDTVFMVIYRVCVPLSRAYSPKESPFVKNRTVLASF